MTKASQFNTALQDAKALHESSGGHDTVFIWYDTGDDKYIVTKDHLDEGGDTNITFCGRIEGETGITDNN